MLQNDTPVSAKCNIYGGICNIRISVGQVYNVGLYYKYLSFFILNQETKE